MDGLRMSYESEQTEKEEGERSCPSHTCGGGEASSHTTICPIRTSFFLPFRWRKRAPIASGVLPERSFWMSMSSTAMFASRMSPRRPASIAAALSSAGAGTRFKGP